MESKLSRHYSSLRTYKNVLKVVGYLAIITSLISFYSIMESANASPLFLLIPYIISLGMTWYVILNTIKIIDFLFDLDKKTNN